MTQGIVFSKIYLLRYQKNSPFPSLQCCYKMNTTTMMQRECS